MFGAAEEGIEGTIADRVIREVRNGKCRKFVGTRTKDRIRSKIYIKCPIASKAGNGQDQNVDKKPRSTFGIPIIVTII